MGANPSDQKIINAFVAANNIEFMRNSITVSSRNIVEQWAQLTAFNNGHQTRVIGSIRVNYNTNVRNRIPNFDLGSDIEITRIINLENLTRNLGNLAYMTRLRDGITVQRLITRFIEINHLPIGLTHFIISRGSFGPNSIRLTIWNVSNAGANFIAMSGTEYRGTADITYQSHDEN